jgi:hypothetical protein
MNRVRGISLPSKTTDARVTHGSAPRANCGTRDLLPATRDRRPARLSDEIERHLRWLVGGSIRLTDGMLAAWVENGAPSHSYQESTAYLLSLLAYLQHVAPDERWPSEAARTARALLRDLGHRAGCGRDGKVYLFDTAVGLRALHRYATTFGESADAGDALPRALTSLAQTSGRLLARKQACVNGGAPVTGEHWSDTYSVHLLKAVHHACPWLTPDAGGLSVRQAVDELCTAFHRDGRFYTDRRLAAVYLHAHCYAMEGLLALEDEASGAWHRRVRDAADWLVQCQTAAGGLPRWWPANDDELAVDATAQAVRVWQCLDPQRYDDAIRRGLVFLRAMAHPDGGFYYSSRRRHVNSWTTIFAVQALLWERARGEAEWLI